MQKKKCFLMGVFGDAFFFLYEIHKVKTFLALYRYFVDLKWEKTTRNKYEKYIYFTMLLFPIFFGGRF